MTLLDIARRFLVPETLPTLRELVAGLSPADRARLDAEAANGNVLAQLILDAAHAGRLRLPGAIL